MLDELRILFPLQIYPTKTGGVIRTTNIAKLASKKFSKTTIFAVDENIEYENKDDGVYIIQEKKYRNATEKMKYYFESLFSPKFSLKTPDIAFCNKDNAIFQIEDPLFYYALKEKDIKKYVLNEHNVCWELLDFPQFNLKYRVYTKLAYKRNKLIEKKALQGATHIIVCSERDKQLILQEIPRIGEKITVIPNSIDFSEYENFLKYHRKENSNKGAFYVLFVGLLSYPPNTDALHLICNKIAPNFGEDVEFLIVGKNPPNIKKPKNVKFLGYVEDIKEYILGSDICIAPLRYGSGTRLKILEYMAMGKPVVSTSKGAEGIGYTYNKNIIIEDNISLFAERIRELIEDEEKRRQIGKAGMELVKEKYDWKIYKNTLERVYEGC